MPINPTPEKIEELRKVMRDIAPFAINLFQALLAQEADTLTDEIVNLVLYLNAAGLME